MAKNLTTSLPALNHKKHLTSDHTSEEFKKIYEERRDNYNKTIEKQRKRLVEIEQQLKVLQTKELQVLNTFGGNSSSLTAVKPGTSNNARPNPTDGNSKADAKPDPKADPKKADPKVDPKADSKKVEPKPEPKADSKGDAKKPDDRQIKPGTSKGKVRPQSKDHKYDPLTNINKPTLDPKMEALMPIYHERRRLKNEEIKIKEHLIEIYTKKESVVEKEKELQLRQNIFKSVNISPEYVKARQEANKSMASMKTAGSMTSHSVKVNKLKQLKRGFYLDIIESSTQKKTEFNSTDKKYDVEFIVRMQRERQEEKKMKYSQNSLKAKTLAAMKDPNDPKNAKILKESVFFNNVADKTKKQRALSPQPQAGGGNNKMPKDDKAKTAQDAKKPDQKQDAKADVKKPTDKPVEKPKDAKDAPKTEVKPTVDAKKEVKKEEQNGEF